MPHAIASVHLEDTRRRLASVRQREYEGGRKKRVAIERKEPLGTVSRVFRNRPHDSLLAYSITLLRRSWVFNTVAHSALGQLGRIVRRLAEKSPAGELAGDLITNSIRYFQRCEGVRPDVQLVDQSMLTYNWFVRVQAKNFPSFDFPGTNYHPYTLGSFSIRQLVEANMDDGRGDLYMAVRGSRLGLG